MIKWMSKRLWLIGLVLLISVFSRTAKAQITISNILIGTPNDGKVQLTWNTDLPARTDVYFGQQNNNLDKYLGNVEYKTNHQADLTGLKKKTDYYYKIVVVDAGGQRAESFIQYFNTDKMKDTTAPIVGGFQLVQVIDTAAVLYFLTNEPSRVNLDYGISADKLDRHWSNSDLRYDHLIILSNLSADSKYYFDITIKDEDNNIAKQSGDFTTDVYRDYDQIKLSQLVPESRDQAPLLPERAAISWNSNVLATAEINYGMEPTKLTNNIKVSTSHQLSHRAELADLKPDTAYYFKIKMSSDLNHKSFESQVYSLKTAPLTFDYLRQYFQSGNILSYQGDYYYLYNKDKVKLNNNSLTERGYLKTAAKSIKERYLQQYYDWLPYWGAYHDGQVVKEADQPTVYVIDGQYKRPIANWSVFKYLNYQATDVIIDRDNGLRSYRDGVLIKDSRELTGKCPIKNYTLAKSPNGGTVYLIANCRKMPIVNQVVFLRLGFKFSAVKTISWGILNQIPNGQVVI